MSNNLHGDISPAHIKLAAELEDLELYFDSKVNVLPPESLSKAYTCMSHDWYAMEDDDKGSQLLDKAEKVCPGYFNKEIHQHTAEDPEYAYLIKSLTQKVLEIAKYTVLGNSDV